MSYVPDPTFVFNNSGYVPDPLFKLPVISNQSGILDISFNGLQSQVSVGINVQAGLLDIVFEPLQILGPVLYIRKKVIQSRLWFFILYGINGHPDITIPISRFTESLSLTELSQYSVIVPDGNTYLADIILRKDSSFVIVTREVYTDDTHEDAYSRMIPLVGVRSDKGANSYSVALTGQIEPIIVEVKKLDVYGVAYILNPADEKRTIRCEDNKNFQPGDIALFDGEELKTATVTRIISTDQQSMQLKEE